MKSLSARSIAFSVSIVFCLAGHVFAQPTMPVPAIGSSILIGPVGGINLISYNTDAFPILNSEKTCFTAQNGRGTASWGGFGMAYGLGATNQTFLLIEAVYDSKSSNFNSLGGAPLTTPTKKNGVVYDGAVETSVRAQLDYVLLNLAYQVNFFPGATPTGPGIAVGPSIGIPLTAKLMKTVTVTAATGDVSNPAAKTTVLSSEDIPSLSPVRIALRGAFTFDLPITPFLNAQAVAGYDMPVTKVNTDYNWMASAAFGGLAIRYVIHE